MPEHPIAYSYIRMSTEKQIEGDSLRRQLELSRQWARDHNVALDESLRDIGISAYKGKNRKEGALGRFLSMVDEGRVRRGSLLIVESLDRISRDEVLEALSLFLEIIRSGITIVTLADNQTYSQETVGSDWSKLIISLTIMARAHEESLRKSQRIGQAIATKRQRAARGETQITSKTPGWIDAERISRDRIIFTLNEHAHTVRRIFELSASGLGRLAIARLLNLENVPTVIGGVSGWGGSFAGALLSRRDVLGEFQPCKRANGRSVPEGEPIPGYYPAVVDLDLFMRSRAMQSQRTTTTAVGRKGKRYQNLFASLVRCEHCHSIMHIRNNGQQKPSRRYLICSLALRGGQCEEGGKNFKYQMVEDTILDHVHEFMLADIMQAKNDSSVLQALKAETASMQAEIDELDRRIKRLILTVEICDEELLPDLMANLKQRRSEREAKQAAWAELEYDHRRVLSTQTSSDPEQEIAQLREEWRTSGEAEAYVARSKCNAALRSFIDFINFNTTENTYTVVILGSVRAYKFQESDLVQKINLVPHLGAPLIGNIDPMVFVTDGVTATPNPQRVAALEKLRSHRS